MNYLCVMCVCVCVCVCVCDVMCLQCVCLQFLHLSSEDPFAVLKTKFYKPMSNNMLHANPSIVWLNICNVISADIVPRCCALPFMETIWPQDLETRVLKVDNFNILTTHPRLMCLTENSYKPFSYPGISCWFHSTLLSSESVKTLVFYF